MLTFMDAFPDYNQIMMHQDDREKNVLHNRQGNLLLQSNAIRTQECGFINRMFADKLGTTIKSLRADDHLTHLQDCFETLNKYGIKLNPAKCTFGVSSGELLGYIVTQQGIEANPKQISAVLDLPSPKNCREVQRLIGRIAALNRIISRSTGKCLPFYDLLRGNKNFFWGEKCEDAFSQLKWYLTTPPILAKPDVDDVLSLCRGLFSSCQQRPNQRRPRRATTNLLHKQGN